MIDIIIDFIFGLGNKIDRNTGKYILKNCIKYFQKSTNTYVTFVNRPKNVDKISCLQLYGLLNEKIAVVIQGPVLERDNFTLETIKLYKKTMPNTEIILSTWNNTDINIVNEFKKLNIEIVLSPLPKHTGIGNMNYQVYSTKEGIKRARELGASYIMKTRTDQRLSQTNLLEYLNALNNTFPICDNRYAKYQKNRIIALQGSVGGNMFIPYFIPDFFFFGNIDDIWNFFNIPLQNFSQTREERTKVIKKLRNGRIWDYYSQTAPEILMTMDYLKRIGITDLPISCAKWWEIVKNLLIFVSYDDVKFFWPKYDNHFDENFISMNYADNDPIQRKTYVWNFHNWLLIKTGTLVYSSICDEYINEKADII